MKGQGKRKREAVDYSSITVGSLWEQHTRPFVGRRGRVTEINQEKRVVLEPVPGKCPCPLRQRVTKISLRTFSREWRLVADEVNYVQ